MRGFAAVVLALMVIGLGLFLLGVVVCPLAVATESFAVAIVGGAVGLPFVFYLGYFVARKVIAAGDEQPPQPPEAGTPFQS